MSNSPAEPHFIRLIERHDCAHGNSLIVDPLGNVIDEAEVFEERLVIAERSLAEASASTLTRTLGQNEDLQNLLSNGPLARW